MYLFALTSLRIVFWVFLLLVVGQSALQRIYASRSTRAGRVQDPAPADGSWPSVDVLIPCYNEDPELLLACCESIAAQRYQGRISVWLIDDGSSNLEALESTYRRYEDRVGWEVVRHPENRGKRRAQDTGFCRGYGALVLTVDSDTRIAPDGVRRLVEATSVDDVGGATGNVGVWNVSTNWLTWLIRRRYDLLCEERAAQSFHGAVLCCAGPFSIYRRSALRQVWSSYLQQTIRGRPCTHGDDNHLTNLVLGAGYRTVFEHRAEALTNVPTSILEFSRQQVRWNRTFYRELVWTVPNLWRRRRRLYLAWQVTSHLLIPLLLMLAAIICVGVVALAGDPDLPEVLGRLAAMAILHGAFVAVQMRDPAHIFLGAVELLLLLPVRIRALATLGSSNWMTRRAGSELPALVE